MYIWYCQNIPGISSFILWVWGNDNTDDDNDDDNNDDNDDASSYDYGSSSSITVAVLVCLVFRGREMDG